MKKATAGGKTWRGNGANGTTDDGRVPRSVPRVKGRMCLTGLVVSGRRGAHLAAHASGRYERGLRADPCRVHRWHLMVSAAAVVVG